MHNDSPENNVYKIPYFLQNKIVSNEMADILVKLLHQDPDKRYEKLVSVKQDLLKLRKNIFETPLLMRQVLRHPILPEEVLDSNIEKFQNVDFRSMKNN
jgi:serine/threonine protein kinase